MGMETLFYGADPACRDTESFVRGGPTMTTFFFFFFLRGEGESKCHYKQTIICLSDLNGDDGLTLIRTSIAKKSYIFCDFYQGVGGPDPLFPLWICACPVGIASCLHSFS